MLQKSKLSHITSKYHSTTYILILYIHKRLVAIIQFKQSEQGSEDMWWALAAEDWIDMYLI